MSAGSRFIKIGWVKPSLIIKDANMLASEAFSLVAVPATCTVDSHIGKLQSIIILPCGPSREMEEVHPFGQCHLAFLCSLLCATSCSHASLPYPTFQICLRSGSQTSAPHRSAGETSVNRILFQKTVPQQTCCFVDIRMFLVAKSLWTNRFFSRYIIPHAIWAAHNLRSFW